MGSSFQEQLLKAGLVDKKQIQKIKQEKRQNNKQQPKGKDRPEDEIKLRAKQIQAEKKKRDRELNKQREEENKQKEIAAQVAQLVGKNRKAMGDGEIPYNFADGAKVKKIFVTKELRDQLSQGKAAIVKQAGKYEVVPAETVEKIRARDEQSILLFNDPKQKKDDELDDFYADYKIPDDLDW